MAQPVSIANSTGQKIDTIYLPDGSRRVKVGVGTYAGAGDAEDGAGQLIGTHEATGAVISAADAIAVIGGVDDSALDGPTGDTVRPFLVDSLGRMIIAGPTDDSPWVVGSMKLRPIGLLAHEAGTDVVDAEDIGLPRMTVDRKAVVTPQAHALGGATPYRLISGATTNATNVKAAAGKIYSIVCSNVNAAVRYLKLYNKASSPTVGSDTPVATIMLPAGQTVTIPYGDIGLAFSLGISFALTTGIGDSDTGAVSANEHVVNLAYA